jgi:hypothetical protein
MQGAAGDYARAAALSRNEAQQRLLLRLAKSLDERAIATTPRADG